MSKTRARTSKRPAKKPKSVPRLGHADRATRRENIAKAITAGESPAAVARKFGVTIRTVQDACREFGAGRS